MPKRRANRLPKPSDIIPKNIIRPSEALDAWILLCLKEMQPGQLLPSDRQLAQTWHLSERTVRRVMCSYGRQGLLCRIPGKGTFIPANEQIGPFPIPETPSKTAAWQTLAEAIFHSICVGDLKSGESLPSLKFIRHKFKVAPVTASRAYEHLRASGHVTRSGRSYWVGGFKRHINSSSGREVYLFISDKADQMSLFTRDTLFLAYQKLERELIACGYVLLFQSVRDFPALLKHWSISGKFPTGFIFTRLDAADYRQLLPPFKDCLARYGDAKPSILVDGQPFPGLPKHAHILNRGNILTTRMRVAARYLVAKRFRSAILFYDEAANQHGYFLGYVRIRSELRCLDRAFRLRVVVKPLEKSPDGGSFFRRLFAHYKPDRVCAILSKYEPTPASVLEDELEFTTDFRQVFPRKTGGEMWLFSNDTDAAAALEWAKENRLEVPDQLSLLGFENNPAFHHLGISSCAFDWDGIGYLMAHALVGDFPLEKTSKGYIKPKALLLERLTTP